MAGTYNSKTGYLDISGLTVEDGITVAGKYNLDSDWVIGLATTVAERVTVDMNVDSDVINKLARSAVSNLNLDSDIVEVISSRVAKDMNIDSEVVAKISATVQSEQSRVALLNVDSDIEFLLQHYFAFDSDQQNQSSQIATLLASDAVQTANINTAVADVLTLSERITINGTNIATNATDIATNAADIAALNVVAGTDHANRITSLEVNVGNVGGGGHEQRITDLETTIAALQAQIAALTLNDLTNVDLTSTAPVAGDVLEFNGTDFVPVATS